jgi:hypothetical protein
MEEWILMLLQMIQKKVKKDMKMNIMEIPVMVKTVMMISGVPMMIIIRKDTGGTGEMILPAGRTIIAADGK